MKRNGRLYSEKALRKIAEFAEGLAGGATMSRASEYAKRRPRPLNVRQYDSPFYTEFSVDENGRLRIDNLGPYSPRAARAIARWLIANFKDLE